MKVLLFLLCSFFADGDISEYPIIKMMHEEAVKVRKENNINEELVLDEECCKIAQRWANHMAETNSMYHGGGEQIIAMGYDTPQLTMKAWRNSSGHWAWLGSKSKFCGWGCQKSSNGTWYWAGVFRNKK